MINIYKPLDHSKNINIKLNISDDKVHGEITVDKKLTLVVECKDLDLTKFNETLINNINISIDVNQLALQRSEDGKGFVAELPKNITKYTLDISLSGNTVAMYEISKDLAELKDEILMDSYFIKNAILNEKSETTDFASLKEVKIKTKTDLHTHYAGTPTAKGLIELGVSLGLEYPAFLLRKAGY